MVVMMMSSFVGRNCQRVGSGVMMVCLQGQPFAPNDTCTCHLNHFFPGAFGMHMPAAVMVTFRRRRFSSTTPGSFGRRGVIPGPLGRRQPVP